MTGLFPMLSFFLLFFSERPGFLDVLLKVDMTVVGKLKFALQFLANFLLTIYLCSNYIYWLAVPKLFCNERLQVDIIPTYNGHRSLHLCKKNYHRRFIWEAVCASKFQKGFLRSLNIITVQVQSNPDLNS